MYIFRSGSIINRSDISKNKRRREKIAQIPTNWKQPELTTIDLSVKEANAMHHVWGRFYRINI
jgi:hypothetical protein